MLNFAFIFLFIWTEGLSKFTLPCCVGLCRYKWVSWFLDKYFKFDLIKYSKEYLIMYSKVDLIRYSKEDLMKYSKEDLMKYSKEPTWFSLPAPTQPCPTWRGYFYIRVAKKKPVSRNQRQMWIANKHIFFFLFRPPHNLLSIHIGIDSETFIGTSWKDESYDFMAQMARKEFVMLRRSQRWSQICDGKVKLAGTIVI